MAELLLTLDTSTTAGSVALLRGDALLGEVLIDTVVTHSDRLLVQTRQLLQDLGLALCDIDAFAVVDGPGSFTGLRVGVATAKGLAVACQRPLIGVSSLDTLAANLPYATWPVCALLDARKQQVYAACFDTAGGEVLSLDTPQVIAPQQLLERFSAPTLFVGSGAIAYAAMIRATLGELAHFAPGPLHVPRASAAARLARVRLLRGEAVTAAALLPRYLRPPEAELQRLQRAAAVVPQDTMT